MKKIVKIVIYIILLTLCLTIFSSCNQKSNENNPPPPLSELSEYSEEQLNEILADYTMFDIREAWGNSETPENITLHCDIYTIQNCDKVLVIWYDYNAKVSSVTFRSPSID